VSYPRARKADIVDVLHGTRVPDPYQWLEDPDSPETRVWVDAENALTRSRLDGPLRERLVAELTALYDYPRATMPFRRGDRYFFFWNPGLRNQPALMVKDALDAPPRPFIDPNDLSPDGTVALTAVFGSDDGRRVAYALSRSGSDRQELLVRDVESGRELPDRLDWVKFASVAWTADGSGFYYLRFPEPGTVAPGDEHYFGRIYFHRLGDAQPDDVLVFQANRDREVVPLVDLTFDDRYVVITAQKGASDRSEIHLIDRHAPDRRARPLFTGYDAAYAFVGSADGRLYFRTDAGAPRGRIVTVDAADPWSPPREIVAERADKLSLAVIARGRLVLSYLHDAADRLLLFGLDGAPAGEVPLPPFGSLASLDARPGHDDVTMTFQSFTQPPSAYRYEIGSGRIAPLVAAPAPRIDPTAYVTEQVWYPSRDGTRVSMFLVHRRDLPRDGNRPVLLTAYGGFNISLTPAFDAANLLLLARDGVVAVPNLRGGGEYGEAWHEAGMRERKQNVFDDFIAAAESLIREGWTKPGRLAIEGGSNGGLLTGAALVQRPDLFGAVVCRVPVADMLRYHLFTIGRFWIPEYGSADDPTQFQYLLAYSPYHNVTDGVAYPPTLVMTADTDDRVSPGMAKKFAARLQAATSGEAAILIRVETKAGHGAGKPVSKVIDEDADIFGFVFGALGVDA
jgi:prolyl oligopeptidase